MKIKFFQWILLHRTWSDVTKLFAEIVFFVGETKFIGTLTNFLSTPCKTLQWLVKYTTPLKQDSAIPFQTLFFPIFP